MRRSLDRRAARWAALRIALVGTLFAAGFAVVACRAVQLQVLERDRLGGLARDQYVRETELKPRRGSITDRNGAVLAADAPADSIYVDPQELEAGGPSRPALQKLARALHIDVRALSRHIARGGRFVWVKRRVSPAESDAVRALGLTGVGAVKESRRYYPRRELAGQVLGFVGDDEAGLEGLEVAFDEALQGEAAVVPSLRDARGMQLLGDAPAPDRVLEGARLELTLEQGLQLAAETALARAVSEAHAAAGMAVVLDPSTGEVLALANAPAFNPNTRLPAGGVRDRAVLDTFEPGSTFKVFSIAGALEEGVLKPKDAIFCENGSYQIGAHTIHDHQALGWVGPSRVLISSLNIGAAKIAARLGPEKLQRTFQSFGFGERTGVELLGEPRGTVPRPRGALSIATMSFGQGLTATPLQITAGMAAVANGGMLMRPWIVRRLVDPVTGKPVLEGSPAPVRRALSPEVAATLRHWLEAVVTDPQGTGKRARVPGWRVAGKTGTAQKADPVSGGYSSEKHFSSFVGFAPADAPRLVIGVFIDEPRGPDYGGEVAAPVFSEIARHALESMGVPTTEPVVAQPAGEPVAEPPAAISEASAAAAGEEPISEVDGAVSREEASPAGAQVGPGVPVPALSGLPARAAVRALEEVELSGVISGSGRVVNQAPRPGTLVRKGSRVRLTLAPPG